MKVKRKAANTKTIARYESVLLIRKDLDLNICESIIKSFDLCFSVGIASYDTKAISFKNEIGNLLSGRIGWYHINRYQSDKL